MKSIKDSETDNSSIKDTFVRAEELRSITLSKEELLEIAKNNISENLMSSMVDAATKNGQMFYAANILASMDEGLRDDVLNVFKDLGYTTHLSEVISGQKTGQPYRVLSISWAPKKEEQK